jgi:MFS superfamily sulfate permease-like transporter
VVLIAVVGATVISAWLGLAETAGVKVLGEIPQGLPSPAVR